ncbi:MAG: rhodanese-related sulfurtransferase [Litorimonas sp.]
MSYAIAALYKFVALDDIEALQSKLRDAGGDLDIRGTLLLAREGLNGTISGSPDELEEMIRYLQSDPRLSELDVKYSRSETQPFLRYKVRLKKEIVTLGRPTVDPTQTVGTYVAPSDWNEVVADPDTVVIDTRNAYEVEVGSFKGALDPKTDSFREFPAWVEANRDKLDGKRIAMFCTGGIRCEKASSFMLNEGFDEVLHLKGGILKYLETQPESTSLWEGDCFVFDQRVAVGHGVSETAWSQCFACRMPLTQQDRDHPRFEEGVSCPNCHDDSRDKDRYRERQRQMKIAKARDAVHLGRS